MRFDAFLPKFRILYDGYHFGKAWDKRLVNLEAAKIWKGSLGNYRLASTTACQGIYESHYEIKKNPLRYRGHMGMHKRTILAEGVRVRLIGKLPKDERWLLRICQKDTTLADELAASRLVYLNSLIHDEKRALRVWVRGPVRNQGSVDLKESLDYANGVLALRRNIFGVD